MRAMRYTDLEGDDIYLVVPWPDGSGNIPPHTIKFVHTRFQVRRERNFSYNGMLDDEAVVITHDAKTE
jgi:hypothetical protein